MEISRRLIMAAALWAVAGCITVVNLIEPREGMGGAAVLIGIVALAPTGSVVIERMIQREHDRTMQGICEVLGHAETEGKLRHLH